MPALVVRRGDRFGARCRVGGKLTWLGTFDTEPEARAAVDAARDLGVVDTVDGWWSRWPSVAGVVGDRSGETVATTLARSAGFRRRFGRSRLNALARRDLVAFAIEEPGAIRWARTILEDAVTLGLLDENPLARVRARAKKMEHRPPTSAEVEALTAALPGSLGPMALVAACSGLRLSELAALEARDVRLEGGVAIVTVRCGKGGVRGESVVLEPGASVVVERAAVGGLLFPRAGGGAWNRQKVNDRWRATCRRLGIEGVRFHDLRHFHASLLVDMGHREIDVAAQLRHRDNGRLVREVYAHPDNAAALRRVGDSARGRLAA